MNVGKRILRGADVMNHITHYLGDTGLLPLVSRDVQLFFERDWVPYGLNLHVGPRKGCELQLARQDEYLLSLLKDTSRLRHLQKLCLLKVQRQDQLGDCSLDLFGLLHAARGTLRSINFDTEVCSEGEIDEVPQKFHDKPLRILHCSGEVGVQCVSGLLRKDNNLFVGVTQASFDFRKRGECSQVFENHTDNQEELNDLLQGECFASLSDLSLRWNTAAAKDWNSSSELGRFVRQLPNLQRMYLDFGSEDVPSDWILKWAPLLDQL